MQVSKDDYDQWRGNEVTKEVFKILRERQQAIASGLAEGGAIISPDNAILVGRYKEIEDLLQMSYEEMREKEE